MHIQFLWWEDCPSHPAAWQRLQQVLEELQLDVTVERIQVLTEADAERWHFPGSPTILVNGKDIDPRAPDLAARLTCRLYYTEERRPSPYPSREMIKRALIAARDAQPHIQED